MPADRQYSSTDDRTALSTIPELISRNRNFYLIVKVYNDETQPKACRVIMNPEGAADELCGDAMTTNGKHEMMCINHLALLSNGPVPVGKKVDQLNLKSPSLNPTEHI